MLPNDLILQWGTYTFTTAELQEQPNRAVTLSLPVSFKSGPYSLMTTAACYNDMHNTRQWSSTGSCNTTHITLYIGNVSGLNWGGDTTIKYLVVGY